MKIRFLLCLFFFFYNNEDVFASSVPSNCEDNGFDGNWTCVKNNDDTVNVTLDCSLTGYKGLEVKFHSKNFPKRMSHFTIQNCELVVLDSSKPCKRWGWFENTYQTPRDTSKINFTHFHAENITNLQIQKSKIPALSNLNDPLPYYALSKENSSQYLSEKNTENSTYFDPHHFGADSLTSITLKNIEKLYFEENIDCIYDGCVCVMNEGLEKFALINVPLDSVKFYLENKKQKFEFLMDNARILSKLNDFPIVIWSYSDDGTVVKIINSDFSLMDKVMIGSVYKLILIGNKFKILGQEAIVLSAREFTFSGNSVEKLDSRSILGEIWTTNISNNTIHQIADGALDTAPKTYIYKFRSISEFSMLGSKNLSRINPNISRELNYKFNFLNNEIRTIEKKGLSPPKPFGGLDFEEVTITNNSIGCSCQNKDWFKYIKEIKEDSAEFYNQITGGNKCSDMEDCNLGRVLNNLESLCGQNYQCPKGI